MSAVFEYVFYASGPQPFMRHGLVSCQLYFHGQVFKVWQIIFIFRVAAVIALSDGFHP